ncbi:MAG: hypothetical protein Q9169_008562, partial [Polycauliona sp. 2 TL-2023]
MPAQAIGSVLRRLNTTKIPGTENVSKVVKTIIIENTILGHNITEIAKHVPTEDVIQATRTLGSAASKTISSSQSTSNSIEATGSFGWPIFIFVLCFFGIVTFTILCLGFLRYRRQLSPAHSPLQPRSFLPLFRVYGSGNAGSGNMGWYARIFHALAIAFGRLPRLLQSRFGTFIGGVIAYHVGKRLFDSVHYSDIVHSAGLAWRAWDVLAGLFHLLRQQWDVVHQWLRPLEQIMLAALLLLKHHWLLILLSASLLTSATIAVRRWRAMDWRDRQAVWFRLLSLCKRLCTILRTILGEGWEHCSSKLLDFGQWCSTQDIRGCMIATAKFEIEVMLLVAQGLYEVHHQFRESQRRKTIITMSTEHIAKCMNHDIEMRDKDGQIDQYIKQIIAKDREIEKLERNCDGYKNKYDGAIAEKQATLVQCTKYVDDIYYTCQREVAEAKKRRDPAPRSKSGIFRAPLNWRERQHDLNGGDTPQHITDLEKQLRQAKADGRDHTSKIAELENKVAALRVQLSEKHRSINTQLPQAQPACHEHISRIANLEADNTSLNTVLKQKIADIDAQSNLATLSAASNRKLEGDIITLNDQLTAKDALIAA